MKQLKTIVALIAGLFAFTSVQAGEMTVSGSMQATYQSEVDDVSGNPLGMNTDLTFKGSTDTDFGTATWTMGTDGTFLGDSGADHTLSLATDMGTFTIGNAGDSGNAVDDITPTAFEEANGSGSGTYNDIGGLAGEMGIGAVVTLPILGTLEGKYIPKVDGADSSDNGNSGATSSSVGSGESYTLKTNLAELPVLGSYLDGATLTTGYEVDESSTVADTIDTQDATAALNYTVGNFAFGLQYKMHERAELAQSRARSRRKAALQPDAAACSRGRSWA